MRIIAKSIQRANIVFVLEPKDFSLPDTATVVALFPQSAHAGSNFLDDAALKLRLFNFPALKMKIVCEEHRLRVEDESGEEPQASGKGREAGRIYRALFPKVQTAGYGFNYDIFYRFDGVIPQRDILQELVAPDIIDDIEGFSWQFTLKNPKAKSRETYFFKVISPLEIALHVNFHFPGPAPRGDGELQALYEKCYNGADAIFSHFSW